MFTSIVSSFSSLGGLQKSPSSASLEKDKRKQRGQQSIYRQLPFILLGLLSLYALSHLFSEVSQASTGQDDHVEDLNVIAETQPPRTVSAGAVVPTRVPQRCLPQLAPRRARVDLAAPAPDPQQDWLNNGRIPRVIYQTYPRSTLTPKLAKFQQSWLDVNPGYVVKLYNDTDAEEFVTREMPEYLREYKALEHGVERADFFRYMVILRYGGVYTDTDTQCMRPLDDFIEEGDRLIAGWEKEVGEGTGLYTTLRRGGKRKPMCQLVQWTFAAVAGHPVLRHLCDQIAASVARVWEPQEDAEGSAGGQADTDHNSTAVEFRIRNNRGVGTRTFREVETTTLELTGPGAFTKAVLGFVRDNPHIPRAVTILPRKAFASRNKDVNRMKNYDVKVIHFHQGSWRANPGWKSTVTYKARSAVNSVLASLGLRI